MATASKVMQPVVVGVTLGLTKDEAEYLKNSISPLACGPNNELGSIYRALKKVLAENVEPLDPPAF